MAYIVRTKNDKNGDVIFKYFGIQKSKQSWRDNLILLFESDYELTRSECEIRIAQNNITADLLSGSIETLKKVGRSKLGKLYAQPIYIEINPHFSICDYCDKLHNCLKNGFKKEDNYKCFKGNPNY